MAKLFRFGMVSLTVFVALVFIGREIPEISILADDPSNDGAVIEVVREPKAIPLVARNPGGKHWTQLISDVFPCGYPFRLALSVAVSTYMMRGLNLLLILRLLRL